MIGRVAVRLSIRGRDIVRGGSPDEVPGLVVKFFNAERTRSVAAAAGRWPGSGTWRQVEGEVTVPQWACEAILQVGLLGATGSWDVDDVAVSGFPR